jgi:hypothetical protein
MNIPDDILRKISENFKDSNRALSILSGLALSKERERALRCILILSDSDYDALGVWVEKANSDVRNIYWYAEYDNRERRKYNFSYPFDQQSEYSYES